MDDLRDPKKLAKVLEEFKATKSGPLSGVPYVGLCTLVIINTHMQTAGNSRLGNATRRHYNTWCHLIK
jgi:hypothetical protein